ncbi:hypothetical protein E5163_01175 [Marinicauda algicola]|uniref:STAS/SEC14 domain-containing protein n=1 Tax=Marinicauda algicola TaxID=2029849 RepID=A0A4S2H2S7_9PROT|nr:hypothetical protein [Marinicauda algicola]TGY89783.1 hypothetical protein E5163_01175 [Marinicauda algicola]
MSNRHDTRSEGREETIPADGNFRMAVVPERGYALIEIFGDRSRERADAAAHAFHGAYRAHGLRALLIDSRTARFPADLMSLVDRYSAFAVRLPRSRVALLVADPKAPAHILAAQALRAAGHEVLITVRKTDAEAFLAARPGF